ncbi:hypothetical protein Xmau_00405 [Xenorhabdus mauleonii]|uniref:Uncharacterized protein n=1 Tax=Xenorhabdus mauleonii TaxID=351675 RepID=A0A1I3IVW5_9GAMM|nr:hypothetical protein [Xenorhabdus mauleonii]PHM46012.1 hypothetical protein Xmau_00405 [Xenorhabdus mauleonii]SFI52086.1 hypothetical protein SAMN05421680_1021 [Xenorhabdus mauleonii]
MSYQPIDLAALIVKIEALESALSITLAGLDAASPSVKNDVVVNLKRFADQHQNPTVKQVYTELANSLCGLNVSIK